MVKRLANPDHLRYREQEFVAVKADHPWTRPVSRIEKIACLIIFSLMISGAVLVILHGRVTSQSDLVLIGIACMAAAVSLFCGYLVLSKRL